MSITEFPAIRNSVATFRNRLTSDNVPNSTGRVWIPRPENRNDIRKFREMSGLMPEIIGYEYIPRKAEFVPWTELKFGYRLNLRDEGWTEESWNTGHSQKPYAVYGPPKLTWDMVGNGDRFGYRVVVNISPDQIALKCDCGDTTVYKWERFAEYIPLVCQSSHRRIVGSA